MVNLEDKLNKDIDSFINENDVIPNVIYANEGTIVDLKIDISARMYKPIDRKIKFYKGMLIVKNNQVKDEEFIITFVDRLLLRRLKV